MGSGDMPQLPAPDPILLYLAQLELALAGRNPALVHDALVDAESHLRAAVAAGASPQRAVDEFGLPEDIAAAYVLADNTGAAWHSSVAAAMSSAANPPAADVAASAASAAAASTTADAGASSGVHSGTEAPPPAASAVGPGAVIAPAESFAQRARRVPVLGIWFHPHAWGSLAYFTTVGFAFALAAFIWVTVVGSVSLGLLPIFIGLALLVLLLGSVRGICLLGGSLCEFFLGVRMPRRTQPVYTTTGISLWQRLGCWLKDVRSWLSLAYLVGNFPVALALFALFISLTAVSASLIGMPLGAIVGQPYLHFDSDSDVHINLWGRELIPDANGDIHMPFGLGMLTFLSGVVCATFTLWLARGVGWVYGHVVQAIQVARPRAVLVRPVERPTP